MIDNDETSHQSVDGQRQRTTRMTITDELRELVAKYIVDQHHSPSEASAAFAIKANTASRIAAVYRAEGRTSALKRGGGHNKKLTDGMMCTVREWVDADCTLPLSSIALRIGEVFGISVSRKTVERTLNELHYTLKRTSLIPDMRNDARTIQLRADFVAEIIALDPNEVVFVDEVGFCYTMRLSRGRSLSGLRANVRVPVIRSKNHSVAAAMDKNALLMYRIQDRPYNTESFKTFMLSLCLSLNEAGDTNRVIIMDNVAFHRASAVHDLCTEHGHRLMFLPPYSPF
jgi:transposase